MLDRKLEWMAFENVHFGDRDILHVGHDLRRAETRIVFSGAEFRGGVSPEELKLPVLVLSGVRSWASLPTTARPETIVLKWKFTVVSGGFVAEFLVVGDPEPVTLRFECERLHMEV